MRDYKDLMAQYGTTEAKNLIEKAIAEALKKHVSVAVEDIPLELADLSKGDYASSVALKYAKRAGMPPIELAKKIVDDIPKIQGVQKIDVVAPGFINFFLDWKVINKEVLGAANDNDWGKNEQYRSKKVMVEYTDPNPFKEFHIGHLVPNALGESLSRLLQFSGAEVKRANWQGDVGVHVAKTLFPLLNKNITDPTLEDLAKAYVEGSKLYDEDTAAKAEIDALNKKIYEKSDPKVNDLYEKGRRLSLDHFEEIYKILGTKFDFYFFESQGGPKGIEVIRKHPDIFPTSDGAVIFRGDEHGLHTRVFINSAGIPTYEAKEIGLALLKKEAWPFDLTITITGNEQAEYFRVVIKAMELALPDLKGKLTFKTNGMLRFAEGKMSSRLGNVIRGENLINDLAGVAHTRAKESRAEDPGLLAQQIAIAAIKYQILKQGFGKDIIFDRDRALAIEGDSGPYLQYTRVRALSLVEATKKAGISVDDKVRSDLDYKEFAQAIMLSRLLARFPDFVMRAADELEPHYVTNYLIELAGAFNSWYASRRIIGEQYPDNFPSYARLLAAAVANTIGKGLYILGIPAPDSM